jgi:uncharacterized membrane protein (DUF4010 family)
MRSPFDFYSVFKFALVLGVVMAATRVLSALYGVAGLLPVAALGGMVDADAVALATARMTGEGLAPSLGVYAVLLAAGVNSLTKIAIAVAVGGLRLGAWFAGGTILAAAAAIVVLCWAG